MSAKNNPVQDDSWDEIWDGIVGRSVRANYYC